MPNVDLQHFLSNTGVFLEDFYAAKFKFPALSPVNLISLQPGLQYNLDIALELFRFC